MIVQRALTVGEQRVRLSFNPSQDNAVDQCKATCAALIDQCLLIGSREAAMAANNIETGCMYMVKALTEGK